MKINVMALYMGNILACKSPFIHVFLIYINI